MIGAVAPRGVLRAIEQAGDSLSFTGEQPQSDPSDAATDLFLDNVASLRLGQTTWFGPFKPWLTEIHSNRFRKSILREPLPDGERLHWTVRGNYVRVRRIAACKMSLLVDWVQLHEGEEMIVALGASAADRKVARGYASSLRGQKKGNFAVALTTDGVLWAGRVPEPQVRLAHWYALQPGGKLFLFAAPTQLERLKAARRATNLRANRRGNFKVFETSAGLWVERLSDTVLP